MEVSIVGTPPAGYFLIVSHTPHGAHAPWFMGPAATQNILLCTAVGRLDAHIVSDLMGFLMGTVDAVAYAVWVR